MTREICYTDIDETFRCYYRPLCLYALHYVHDTDGAEDIVQDCFMLLWERLSQGGVVLDVRPYLYTAVRNRCLDALRDARRADATVPVADLADSLPDDDCEERSFVEARMWTAIDALPARCREVLLLCKRDGLKYEEVASRLGISVQTVKNQMSKALKALKEGGLFSAFNTDVVKNIDFYKSAFPARYGGRLSSVVDVCTDDGDMKQLHGSLSLGLVDGRLHLEGPLRKDRTSFSVAMRRTWADVVTAPTMALLNRSSHDKLNTRYAFYDFNAKLTHVFSPRSRADLSFYMGNDRLKVDNTAYAQGIDQFDRTRFDLQWGNLTASLNWKYLFSPQLFATFTAVYTRNRSVCDYSYEERLTDPDGNPLGSLTERLSRSTINRRAEGDEVSVRAEARGLPAVQARTSLPAAFPLVGLERRLKQGVYRSEQFRITFRDRPDTADYYGLRIVRRTVFGRLSFGQESTRYEVLSLDVENEPLLNGRNGLDAALNLPNDFYGNLYIWDDSRLQSREYTLCVETNYMEDWDPDEWNGQYQRFAYKVLLYTLSPELYRYLRSLNANDNNDLGHTGLAPMRSNYTNVDGGIGVLGGCHLTETDWLDSLPSE